MWWLIPIGLGLLGLISAAVSQEERAARITWETKREEVQKTLEEQQELIDKHLSEVKQSYDFYKLTEMHFASLMVADAAYKMLSDARKSLAGIGKMLVAAKEKRDELFEKKKKRWKKDEWKNIQEEIKSVLELRKSLFEDKDKVKEQRDQMLAEVKQLNNRTHELKILIRDRCGQKGLDWYNKIEQKQLSK
jgi:uncharacterized protein (DUF3084 family)